MPAGSVQRPDQGAIDKNHEDRIRALERAPHSPIYVDDRILAVDVDVVVFDGFPSNLEILELTWNAWLVSGASVPAVMYVAFDGDYPSTEEDYFWTLAGSIGLSTNGAGDDSWGGLAPIPDYQVPCSGRVRFPNYDNADPHGFGPAYVGEATGGGGSLGPVDSWVIGGHRSGGDPLTRIQVHANGENWEAGSRFTVTAY